MADYDIAEAFQKIEEEMIASMSRNLKRHLKKELDEGINYSMWQAEQLAALNNFRKENAKVFKSYFSTINQKIETVLKMAHASGAMDQETRILEAIKKGWKVSSLPTTDALQGSFFQINERKLNALIEATTKDMAKAETAMLRMANDEYRKIIYNSEVYYNTGAGTLSQCVDMATKDFLSRGISCIEYANGARVGIDSYAAMALRTAQTRAYLTGEASMRDEWGVSTVRVNRNSVACPLCLQYIGQIFYDDVWGSTPIPSPPKYPRLSEAIAGGLYHPNCRDIHSTYFEDFSSPSKPLTEEEKKEAARVYDLEQKQRYNERQIRKYKRLSAGSTDPENVKKYEGKLSEWQTRQREFVKANGDVLKRRYENEKLRLPATLPEPPKIPSAPKKQEPPEIPNAPKKSVFVEKKDAIDFAYGDYTKDDYIKWMDAYDAHNSGVHLSDQELKIIDDYTEGSFIGLNDVGRYSDAELLKKGYSAEDITRLRKKADMLDGALSKYDLDTDIVTHRFEKDVSWLTGNGNGIEDLEKLVGTEYTAKGFTSSGMLPNRFRFSGGKSDAVHFEIVTPKGTNGAFLSMSKKGENEFLYNRNTRFKVLDGGERVVKENKFNFKTMQVEEIEVKERFLRVQAIPDDVLDDVKDVVKESKKQAFVPASSKQEAIEYAKHFNVNADYSKYNLDVANAINETMSTIEDTFGPEALEHLHRIGTFPEGYSTSWAGAYVRSDDLDIDGSLWLRNVGRKDALAKLESVAKSQYKIGHWSTGEALQTIRHELGHAIHRSLGTPEIDAALNAYRKEIQDELLEMRKKRDFSKNYSDWLSEYGMTNTKEFVAESIAEYLAGDPRETARKVVEILTGGKIT